MSKIGRIYLTGMMGSGKSTLGRLAAQKLSKSFVDLDTVIESKVGSSVTEIFTTQGEAFFRCTESEALIEISSGIDAIIALGGGALLRKTNQEFVLRSGTLVYLSVNAETLYERVGSIKSSAREKRPLLLSTGDAEAGGVTQYENMQRLLVTRLAGYQRAHLTVDVGGCTQKVALSRLIASIISIEE